MHGYDVFKHRPRVYIGSFKINLGVYLLSATITAVLGRQQSECTRCPQWSIKYILLLNNAGVDYLSKRHSSIWRSLGSN